MVVLIASLAMLQPAMAERHEGTIFTLTAEHFEDCVDNNGSTYKIRQCQHDIPEIMRDGSNFDLKNFFYWITQPSAAPPAGFCVIVIEDLESRNYTYSINIPVSYNVSGVVNNFWYSIRGSKYEINKSLSGSEGSFLQDFNYDDNYTLTVFSTGAGTSCNQSVVLTIDRSEFEKGRSYLAWMVLLSLMGASAYFLVVGRGMEERLALLTKGASFILVYSSFYQFSLIEREYIKIGAINSNLEIAFMTLFYSAWFIATILLMKTVLNSIDIVESNRRLKRGG